MSSPQKRTTQEVESNDAKRPKLEETPTMDDIFNDDILTTMESKDLLTLPQMNSGTTTAMDTPTLMSLELTNDVTTPLHLQLPLQGTSQQPQAQAQVQGQQQQKDKPPVGDPDKLSDALVSAGVDLKAEEAYLNSTVNVHPSKSMAVERLQPQGPIIINTPFLDPRQLTWFMDKIISANGLKPHYEDNTISNLMTYATEEWMKNVLTNAIILSRHRRRSIKNKKRSELNVAIRDLNVKAKIQEDRRQERKKMSGMDPSEDKEATEEIQHKATNATVAMMTGKKKKYDWMNSGGGGSKSSTGDVSTRFREAREEPGLVLRDLLNSLEKKRMGVEKTITKGYAKLKD
jgi:hypothetical protein